MAESKAHRQLKRAAAGKGGFTEVAIGGVGRIDAVSKDGRPTEIERSNNQVRIASNVKKLNGLGGGVLKVPHGNLPMAKQVAKQTATAPITVSNLGGTKKTRIMPK